MHYKTFSCINFNFCLFETGGKDFKLVKDINLAIKIWNWHTLSNYVSAICFHFDYTADTLQSGRIEDSSWIDKLAFIDVRSQLHDNYTR